MIRVAICDDNKVLLIICHKLSNPNLKDRIMKILS